MSDIQVRGPLAGASGSPVPFTASIMGAQRTTDAHGRYFEAVRLGNVYALSVAAATPTAYIGAAAGTPLLAVHNPANSGKLLVLMNVSISVRAVASVAGVAAFDLWTGPSVLPTGTATPPTNVLSQSATGSAAKGFINTALTSSTALNLALGLGSFYWATAASALFASIYSDVAGLIVLAPGNEAAFGATAVLTSATYDAAMYWEEVPFLP